MTCGSCGTENEAGRKFCIECGTGLARSCDSCGSPNPPEAKFCSECGAPFSAVAAVPRPVSAPSGPAAERRLVSVLFADLVGFTAASESRDAEDTREQLSRYFDTCRRLVELYGGTVEKFIGDAVMAVWGTPLANEDDAERAVRAGIDLVAAVADLHPGLHARVGVLTGEAAVTLGAEGQGMVAGDLVNTASRIQSAAEPGTVLVGEATKRTTEAAIAYADAGAHELKGKTEPAQLWRAVRVTAGRAGALKSAGLEPPFVGRDRELRLVKELFHASAEEKKAHLVSVVGIAGIGKSRIAWELEKYIDGLVDTIFWHRGRCLAYGEGVAYWALAEMIRMRARIAEGEDTATAAAKLREAVQLHVPNQEERDWVEPRLAHLIGVEDGVTRDRDDLFAAWRLFIERMAEQQPLIMVFEDLQWADASLLDFVEYLLEWSRNHAIFVLALARPELAEIHPGFGGATRNATTLSLEPLSEQAMGELLDGFVPGLPGTLRQQILGRAEGVPLYAVETVRMLLDRGVLEPAGDVYRPTGPIDALDIPETLHALIAARLDGLSPDERRLVQDASVLGKVFYKQALAQLAGISEEETERVLTALVRKEVLGLQSDPRSPERGQYGFLQDLLRRVAYETLAKADRKTRHLAAAQFIEHDWGPAEHEIAEVIASHLVAAYEAAPDADDAAEIKGRARAMLARAAERSASLAASEEAARYFEKAAALADDPLVEAELLERTGEMTWARGRAEEAQRHFERAIALYEQQGLTHPAARVAAHLGEVEWQSGHLDDALDRMERAFEVLSAEEPDEDFAALAAQLGRLYFFKGEFDLAKQRVEAALVIAESDWLPGLLADALISEANVADAQGRSEKALALTKHAAEIALEHDIASTAIRAYFNLGDLLRGRDRYEEALAYQEQGLALSRKLGASHWEVGLLLNSAYTLALLGRLDEATARIPEEEEGIELSSLAGTGLLNAVPMIEIARGHLEETQKLVARLERLELSSDWQERTTHAAARALLLGHHGAFMDALAAAEQALEAMAMLGPVSEPAKAGFVAGVEAALGLGDLERADGLINRIEILKPGAQPPFLRAHAARFRSRLSIASGSEHGVEQGFKTAAQILREHGMRFWLAVVQLEHGEWLVDQDRAGEASPLLQEARETFNELGATLWLERATAVPTEVLA